MADIDEDIKKINQTAPALPERAEMCVKCKYMHLAEPILYQCRRRAPTRDLQCIKSCYPPVQLLDWCGEFEEATRTELLARKVILKAERGLS